MAGASWGKGGRPESRAWVSEPRAARAIRSTVVALRALFKQDVLGEWWNW